MFARVRARSTGLETASFALLVAFAFVLPWRQGVTLPGDVTIGPAVALVLAVVWGLAVLGGRELRRPHPFHAAFGLFAALAAASYAWTIDPSGTATRVATLAYVLVVLVIAWDLLRTRERIAVVAQALVLGVFLVGVLGVWNLLAQGGLTRAEPIALGANPNELARWAVLAAPLSAGLLASSTRFGSGSFGYVNVAYLVGLPFTVLATGSRQGAVGLVALGALGLVVLASRRRELRVEVRHVAVGLGLFGGVVWTVRSVASLDVFLYRRPFVLRRIETLGGRIPIWAEGFEAARQQPILGVGAGAYGAITPDGMTGDPHNTLVGVGAELGVVGVATFLLVVAIPAATVVRRPGPTYASAGILLAFALFSAVAMLYTDPFNWLVLLLVLAAHSAHPAEGAESTIGLAVRPSRSADADERTEPVPD